jgi:PadR family transcriptional regulator PadR
MNQKELLKGNTDTLLLSLLTQEAMYGYQIVKEMERRSSGYFQFKEGTLYPALHRLEEAKLVEGRWEEMNMGTPRRYYHITAKGERVLSERTSEWKRFATAVNAIMVPKSHNNSLPTR